MIIVINIFTIQESNKLTSENITSRLSQEDLASKNDIANFVNKTDFDDKLKNLDKKNYFKKNKTFPDNSVSPSIKWWQILVWYLKQAAENRKTQLLLIQIQYFYIYELDTWSKGLSSKFTLKDWLFRGFVLAKNADSDRFVYIGYGLGFHLFTEFSLSDGRVGKNVISFRSHMSLSVHIDNKKK